MIYYFSGTGNSAFVAKTLANILGEELKFIPSVDPRNEQFSPFSDSSAAGGFENYSSGNVGFIFPVYSWGVPPLVLDFISKLPASFWETMKVAQNHVWCVMTCGDEVALAPEMLQKALKRRGVVAHGIWSIIMPNNYVILPGFDVDSKNVEDKKLEEAPKRILEIAQAIAQNEPTVDVVRGSIPWLKTKFVYPLFKRWGIQPGKWHYTTSCVGCGKCAKACPLHNIEMDDKHPVWGKNCCSCLACYHICPYHAVAYGKETAKKGQYFFPHL